MRECHDGPGKMSLKKLLQAQDAHWMSGFVSCCIGAALDSCRGLGTQRDLAMLCNIHSAFPLPPARRMFIIACCCSCASHACMLQHPPVRTPVLCAACPLCLCRPCPHPCLSWVAGCPPCTLSPRPSTRLRSSMAARPVLRMCRLCKYVAEAEVECRQDHETQAHCTLPLQLACWTQLCATLL